MAGANIIIRPLGPIVEAAGKVRNALYTPPRSTISNIDDGLWPNPLQPIRPMGPPKAEPLAWPFNWGQNLVFTPRDDAEFDAVELRRMARYPLARICIENCKDLLSMLPWRIQLRPKSGETAKDRAKRSQNDSKLQALNTFFQHPNGFEDWTTFIRPILEDMLVLDAASIFVGRDKKGNVKELRWVDGSSINRLVDDHGWTPAPPNPAYQQLWQGYPRLDLTSKQLVYRPRNIVPRNTQASYLYGYSPTEQIAPEIKIGSARLQFIYDFYAEGTIPGGILFAPIGTTPDKIKEAQQFLDSDLAGQLAKRRRLQILQGFQEKDGKNEQVVFPKEPALADVFDDIHIRKVCFAYGVSPQRLMKSMNRASAVVTQESAEAEGTMPFMSWLKGLVDHIIYFIFNEDQYEFSFEPFAELDRLKQAMADESDIKIGLYTRNEIRERRGDDARPEPEADELNITTNAGVVALDFVPPAPGVGGDGVSSTSSRKSKTPAKTSNVRGPKGPAAKVASEEDNEETQE